MIRISESVELPITIGTIEVDSSDGSITIFMRAADAHTCNESLTIKKISNDNNIITLFSESVLINKANIILFGLPKYANVKKGKVKTLKLKSDGNNWTIIHEE